MNSGNKIVVVDVDILSVTDVVLLQSWYELGAHS